VDSLSAELTVAFSAFENFVPGGPPPESSFDLDSFIENTLNPLCARFHEVKQVVDNLMMPPGQKKLRRSASDPIETKHAGEVKDTLGQAEEVTDTQGQAEEVNDTQGQAEVNDTQEAYEVNDSQGLAEVNDTQEKAYEVNDSQGLAEEDTQRL
ncbi:unnamed protein product, partial [Prorocentrum cordatum]